MMARDGEFVQIVDRAMAEAARKSGGWMACKPGCTACCMGPFPITRVDAIRLQQGLRDLERQEADRAAGIRERARQWLEQEDVEDLACPALDPATGLCDLYEVRPITCRVFGPAVRWGSDAVGTCELCYVGATDEQIAECVVEIDAETDAELEESDDTNVALALTASPIGPGFVPAQRPPRS
jgi:Fe-S-cluster containining protein